MKVKKDSVQLKDGNKPLSLNVTNEAVTNDNVADSGTPLLFDPNDPTNPDFADMMQYNTFFPPGMYNYGNYQGQYPAFNVDPEMFESMFMNPLFSPDANSGHGEDSEVDQSAVIPTTATHSHSSVKPGNLENYSLTVKVRHPEKVASVIKGSGKPATQTNVTAELTQENQVPPSSADQHKNQRSKVMNTDRTENAGSSLGKHFPSSVSDFNVHNTPAVTFKNEKESSIDQVTATPVPTGSIVLADGTVLIPAANQPYQKSHNTQPELKPTDLSAHLSEALSQAQKSQSTALPLWHGNNQLQTPGGLAVSHSTGPVVPVNGLETVLQSGASQDTINSLRIKGTANINAPLLPTVLTDQSAYVEKVRNNSVVSPKSVYETPSPTPTANSQLTNSAHGRRNKNRQEFAVISPSSSADSEGGVSVVSAGRSQKNSNKRTIKRDAEEDSDNSATSSAVKNKRVKIPSLTPVSKITNIVGVEKKSEIEKNELLKEAVSKPIKHRTETVDVDTVQERSIKNAINARMNRQKHKVYVQTLEEENSSLKETVSSLESEMNTLNQEKEVLNSEVVYLKKVIANQSSLSNVLSGLNNVRGVALTSHFARQYQELSATRENNDSSNSGGVSNLGGYTQPPSQVTGGVCIHVTGTQASLELCQKCAKMASKSNIEQEEVME